MPIQYSESMNATLQKLLRAITEVDVSRIEACCRADVILQVPGARAVDLTRESRGVSELAAWAKGVHELCGLTRFVLHRYFENGCETMASGEIQIERLPRHFNSPCSIHVRFEAGRIASFQLLLDTYGLEKFRGEMD
jgi:ketosteroid isomerase-like protein